jgi:hypothetical protein
MIKRWIWHPFGWHRPGASLVYRGDFRIRLQSAMWQWHGLDDRRWHIWFHKADASCGAIHRSFTVALVMAIFHCYRNYFSTMEKTSE